MLLHLASSSGNRQCRRRPRPATRPSRTSPCSFLAPLSRELSLTSPLSLSLSQTGAQPRRPCCQARRSATRPLLPSLASLHAVHKRHERSSFSVTCTGMLRRRPVILVVFVSSRTSPTSLATAFARSAMAMGVPSFISSLPDFFVAGNRRPDPRSARIRRARWSLPLLRAPASPPRRRLHQATTANTAID